MSFKLNPRICLKLAFHFVLTWAAAKSNNIASTLWLIDSLIGTTTDRSRMAQTPLDHLRAGKFLRPVFFDPFSALSKCRMSTVVLLTAHGRWVLSSSGTSLHAR